MNKSTALLSSLAAAMAAGCARHDGTLPTVVTGPLPQFEVRTEVPTRQTADEQVAHSDYDVADFNGDGDLDMAVIGLGGPANGRLNVLLGNATAFQNVQTLDIGGLPLWIAGGDFDADLDRDLVVVRSAANATDVYENDGNGGFSLSASLPVGQDALAVVVEDVDGDGNLDVLVSRPVAPEIVVHHGDGLGGFSIGTPISLPGGGSALNLAVGDVTRDGWPDLVVADPVLSRVLVFVGSGPNQTAVGSFAYELSMSGSPRAVSIGDLSGDGWPDMAVSAFDANKFVVVTEIDPYGKFTAFGGGSANVPYASFDVPVDAPPSVSTIADVTGDGVVDLVACLLGRASMVIVPQNPQGGLDEFLHLDATGLPLRPFVGDFDRNGKADLFALSGLGDRVNLWRADANGRLLGARSYASGLPTAAWVNGGDFDRDGKPEVVVGSYDSTRLTFLNRAADGALRQVHETELGAVVFQVETQDLDVDGDLDLIASCAGGVKLLRNDSTAGGFTFTVLPGLAVAIGGAAGPFGVAVADFDRDGDFDLAVCDFLGGALRLVPGTATPFEFGVESVLTIGGGPLDVVAADFTGDGRPDLAVSRSAGANIGVLRNNGNMVFTPFLDVPVGQSPNYLITADFNRDNRADLVVSNADSDTISVLFGREDGFSTASYPAGLAPTALLADDLTGDGLPDVLVASLVSGDFRVLAGNGSGSFPDIGRYPGTFGASGAKLLDVDQDGRKDVLISTLLTSRISLVMNITNR